MKHRIFPVLIAFVSLFCLTQCTESPQNAKPAVTRKDTADKKKPQEDPKPFVITYHALPMKDSGYKRLKRDFTAEQRTLIYALNRIDPGNVRRADTLIIPDTFLPDLMAYTPFPREVPFLRDVRKIIFFSYPIQAFGAYEYGKLIRWGPSSMGKKATPTPTGLFFANWKALETHSTVNDEWVLKWNFNISNRGGVGWHLYALPGYPASHSCLRLLEIDARYLYDWAEQWKLKNDQLVAHGTPAIVYGAYPWGARRPWKEMLSNPKANEISADTLQHETESFLPRILEAQQRRDSLYTPVPDTTVMADTAAVKA